MSYLRELILAEHSKNQRDRIISYIGTDKEKVAELMSLFFADEDPKIRQRAAYVVGFLEDIHYGILQPFYSRMVQNLSVKGHHNAIVRNTIRVVKERPLSEDDAGLIIDQCFKYLEDNSVKVAIRAWSLEAIYYHGNQYAELMEELKLMIEDHLPYALPAYKTKARGVLKKLSN